MTMAKLSQVLLLVLSTLAQAHYTIPRASANGVSPTDWQVVRKTANYQSNGPVTDVASADMTCYQLASGAEGASVLQATAGKTVTFGINPNIYHPGPVNVYMAKAPGDVTTFDGKGKVWFKVYGDEAVITSSSISWPNNGKSTIDVPIPTCIANGQYLIRFEHIGLHVASSAAGAQLYLSCAQVNISGGTGTYKPSLLSFPGAYSPNDPGLLINIYWPIPTSYTSPGGPKLQC